MKKQSSLTMILVTLLFFTSATATALADDILSVVPDNALGFMLIPHVDGADSKISEIARLLQLPVPSLLAMGKAKFGIEKGIDENGGWAIALVADDAPDAPPVPLLIAAATNYEDLVKQLDPNDAEDGISEVNIDGLVAHVGKKGNFAVITPDDYRDHLKAALDSKKSIADNIEPLNSFVADGDASLVITTAGVKLGSRKILEQLAKVKGLLGARPETKSAVVGIEMYENLFQATEKNVTHFGLSLRVQMDGTCSLSSLTILDTQMQDVKGGPAAEAVGKDALATLPLGPYVVAFHGSLAGGFPESMLKMSVQMTKSLPGSADLTDDQIKKIVDASMKSMEGVKSMSALLGVGKPGDALYSNMAMAMTVEDSKQYLANYERTIATMRGIGKDVGIPFYQFEKPKRIDIDGLSALQISMGMPDLGDDAANEAYQDMMKKMFGGDGRMRFYLAAADKQTVVGAYVTTDSLSKAVKAAKNRKSSLAADSMLAKTSAMLPAGSQWGVYISPKGAIDFANSMGALFAPPGVGIEIPPFPETQPVGFAIKSSLSRIETNLVLPRPVLEAIGAYAKKLRGAGAVAPADLEAFD